jgi:hypothetical protein
MGHDPLCDALLISPAFGSARSCGGHGSRGDQHRSRRHSRSLSPSETALKPLNPLLVSPKSPSVTRVSRPLSSDSPLLLTAACIDVHTWTAPHDRQGASLLPGWCLFVLRLAGRRQHPV